MRARFLDPRGRKLWRRLPFVLPTFALLFAMFGPLDGFGAAIVGLSAWVVLNVAGLFKHRQKNLRDVELECGAGFVDVKNAGSRNQRIAAKDITGGTTARSDSGILLTLQHRRRDEPVTIELASEADVERVRQSLGIGHGGFGEIAWRTQNDSNWKVTFVGHVLGTAAALLTIVLTLAVSREAGLVGGILVSMFAFVGAILALVGATSPDPPPTIVMTAAGVRLRTPGGLFVFPYAALHAVEDEERRFRFRLPPPYDGVIVEHGSSPRSRLSHVERQTILAQLTSAAQRARGMGPRKEDITGRLDVLRRNGSSARDWLARLDMAGQMLAAGSGYRGNTLDTEDLWAILEDPEAEPELRAATARVLRHAPRARVRIDAAVAAVRDEPTTRRFRIAVQDDLDHASEALAFLDEEERVRRGVAAP